MLAKMWGNIVWRRYADASGVLLIAALFTFAVLEFNSEGSGDPVVVVSEVKLLTPRVPVSGDLEFQVWRKSNESCPGAGVVAFTRMDGNPNEPVVIISARYPLGLPGYNSPPPLRIKRELPPAVTPGLWKVRTGVDSRCPTRTQFDPTGEFEVEVYQP